MTELRCIGGSDESGRWKACDNAPRYRTPYRSTFPQRPVCAEHARNGLGVIDVTPHDPYGEFHYSPLYVGMCRNNSERERVWGEYVAEDARTNRAGERA